jgi:hypothetical protein
VTDSISSGCIEYRTNLVPEFRKANVKRAAHETGVSVSCQWNECGVIYRGLLGTPEKVNVRIFNI